MDEAVPVTDPRTLGAAVRAARRQRNLTQAELADAAHVSVRWLVALEAGHAQRAELGKLLSTVTALGLQLQLATPAPVALSEAEQAALDVLDRRANA